MRRGRAELTPVHARVVRDGALRDVIGLPGDLECDRCVQRALLAALRATGDPASGPDHRMTDDLPNRREDRGPATLGLPHQRIALGLANPLLHIVVSGSSYEKRDVAVGLHGSELLKWRLNRCLRPN